MRTRLFLVAGLCALLVALPLVGCAPKEESVLEKIQRTGEVTIGHREGSVPFGFYDEAGNWVGFSIDLGGRLVEELEKALGMDITYTKMPVNPKTRIPLVANRTIDIVMGSSTHTIPRDDTVDFTITFFLTGSQLLVAKGSPIRDFEDLAGKKAGAALGSTNEKALRDANAAGIISPAVEIIGFEEHPKGFLALQQGIIDAYCTDGSLLAGMRQAAPTPGDWEVVGRLLTYDPYAYIVPEGDSDWRDFVNTFLIHLIKSGEFYEVYDKWMGPNGKVPLPISDEYRTLLTLQAWPE
ncbi:Glutamate/aspartate import solute-binding protein [subsurface metagenome]